MSAANQLPFLPGYKVDTEKRTSFHKPHYFEVSNGTRIDHSQQLAINNQAAAAYKNATATDPLAITTSQATLTTPAFHDTFAQSISSSMSQLPAWVAYDRKVLRFYGYFKEAVHSSPVETWRVRRCVLYLYLEDESIHIAEPRIENSGIPQGVFVKRHRIPKADTNQLYTVNDLRVGAELLVYGRVFHLVDADEFTRDFYAKQGVQLKGREEYPVDAFTIKSQPSQASTHKLMHPHKLYMEAALGKPILPSAAATQQFLTLDGHVLRFYAQWDDDKMYGEKKPYIVHFYLADDTVEVNEIQTANNGRDPFPTLLKRGKLPKDWQSGIPNVSKLGATHDELTQSYYGVQDFRIGNTINVYGRLLLICSMDKFTQKYYIDNFSLSEDDFNPINMSDPESELDKPLPPPYTGFGTEEDSMGSYLFLVPKVPKIDYKRRETYDGVHLRFLSKFSSTSGAKVDRDRRFIITVYVSTEQISIFERLERNSGFLGGKFLEKSKLKNPRTGKSYEWRDFTVGGRVTVNEYEFEVVEADEYSRKWMARQGQEEEKTQF